MSPGINVGNKYSLPIHTARFGSVRNLVDIQIASSDVNRLDLILVLSCLMVRASFSEFGEPGNKGRYTSIRCQFTLHDLVL